MVDRDSERTAPAGSFGARDNGAPARSGPGAALIAAAVWIVLSGGAFAIFGSGADIDASFSLLRAAGIAAVILVPPVLGLMLAGMIHLTGRLDQVTDRLAALPGLPGAAGSGRGTSPAELAAKLDRILDGQRRLDGALARSVAARGGAAAAVPASEPAPREAPATPMVEPRRAAKPETPEQPEIAPASEAFGQPLSFQDFVTALQFPANAQDKEGFRALRRALHDNKASQLVTAAQDILTLLSQDGIYMDEMRPEAAGPSQWRQFAKGERSAEIEAIGTLRDPEALEKVSNRMRQDTIFRDAAHHFLRLFDHIFSEIAADLSDREIADLIDTRTARAFMLLGQVAGTFD